jgi:hypothetical protein
MFSQQSQGSWWADESSSDDEGAAAGGWTCPICQSTSYTLNQEDGMTYCDNCASASQSQGVHTQLDEEDAMQLGARTRKGNLMKAVRRTGPRIAKKRLGSQMALPSVDKVLAATQHLLKAWVDKAVVLSGVTEPGAKLLRKKTGDVWFSYLTAWSEAATRRSLADKGESSYLILAAYYSKNTIAGLNAFAVHKEKDPPVNTEASTTGTSTTSRSSSTKPPSNDLDALVLSLAPSPTLLLSILHLSLLTLRLGVPTSTLVRWCTLDKIPYFTAYNVLSADQRMEIADCIGWFRPSTVPSCAVVEDISRVLSTVMSTPSSTSSTASSTSGLANAHAILRSYNKPKPAVPVMKSKEGPLIKQFYHTQTWAEGCFGNAAVGIARIGNDLSFSNRSIAKCHAVMHCLKLGSLDPFVASQWRVATSIADDFAALFVDSRMLPAWLIVAWKLCGGLVTDYHDVPDVGAMPLTPAAMDEVAPGPHLDEVLRVGKATRQPYAYDGKTNVQVMWGSTSSVGMQDREGRDVVEQERKMARKIEEFRKGLAADEEMNRSDDDDDDDDETDAAGDAGADGGGNDNRGGGRRKKANHDVIQRPHFVSGTYEKFTNKFTPKEMKRRAAETSTGPLDKPSKFLAFYVSTYRKEGAKKYVRESWDAQVFPRSYTKVVERCATYAGCSPDEIQWHIERIDAFIVQYSRTKTKSSLEDVPMEVDGDAGDGIVV